MACFPKDKNNLGHFLNSIYVFTEQCRYGESKRASSISVSGKTKTQFKAVYEKTLENIDSIQKNFQKDVENESKRLRRKYDHLIVEKDNECGRLRQLHEDSQKKQEIYKNKARDLMEENLVLKKRNEDSEAYLNAVSYANLSHQLQDCLQKNEAYKNKTKDLLSSKQELEKRSQEQIQKALQEKNNLNTQLKEFEKEKHEKLLELRKQFDKINEARAILHDDNKKMQHQNNKNQDIIEKKNGEIAQLKSALKQNEKEKEQLKSKVEVDKGISAKPALLSLQIDDNIARKTHSNLLQSAPDKQTCINCRKLQDELKNKVKEINELRIDEADFKNAGFKKRPSSVEYVTDSYLKQNNELESKNKELQRKNQELAENLRSVQNDLHEYRNPYGKPTYADLWTMNEENKQRLNKKEKNVKTIETTLKETQQKYSDLQENLVQLNKENEEKIKHHQKIQAEFENSQATLRKTQDDITERKEIFKKTQAVLRKIEAVLKETQEKYLLLQKDNEKLLKENEDGLHLRDLLKETQQNYLSLQENYDEKLSKENEALTKEIEENQIALMKYKEREDKLRNNESDLREEIKQLSIKEDNLKKTLQEMQQIHLYNEKLTKENEELKKEIEESFDVRSKIEMELESMQKTFQETHNDLIQHKQKKENLKKTELAINDLQEKYSNLEERNRQLIKINDDNLEDLRQFQTKYEDIQTELKTVRKEFEECRRINKDEKKKEERKRNEEDQIKTNQHSEREENIKIVETTLKERENACKVKEENLQKYLSNLKCQEETLQNHLAKINQRETEIDGRVKNIVQRETRIKEEEIATHKKEENLSKIEEAFEKSKTELTVQITNLNENYIILQREKEETVKTYQHLLKQFVQTQEELEKNKKALKELEVGQNEEKKKYFEEKEVLRQQCNLLETKLLNYDQSSENFTYDLRQKNKLEHQVKNQEETLNQEKLKLKTIKEEYGETTYKQMENVAVLNKKNEELLQANKQSDLLVRETDNRNADLEEKVTDLTRQNQNLLREKEQNDKQIADLFQTSQRLQEEIKEVKQKLDENEKLLKKKTQQTEKADAERKTVIEKCDYLERCLKSLSDEKEDSSKKVTTLQHQVSVLKNTNNQLIKKKEEIEHELSSIQEVLKNKNELTEEVSELKIRIENLLEERTEYFNTNDEFFQKYEVLRKENEQLCGKLKARESTVQMSEVVKAKLLQDSQSLKKELEEAIKKNSDQTREIAKANQECSTLKQKAENLRNVYEEKIRKLEDNFKKDASELSDEVSSLKKGKEKFEKEMRNAIQQLEGQMQEKNSVIENLNKLTREAEAELKNKQKSKEEMRKLLIRLQESEAGYKAKENMFITKEKDWGDTESNLNKQLSHMKQEATKTDQENKDLLRECETLKHELKNAQHEKHGQGIEENNLKSELVCLNDNNKKLENHLNAILQKNLKLENEIQVIKTDLDQYKNETVKPTYEELSASLAQLEQQLKEKIAILEKKDKLLKEAKRKLEESDALVEKTKTELKLKKEEFNTKINEYVKIERGLQENAVILKQENAALKEKVLQTSQENELLKEELETRRFAYEDQSRKNKEDFKNEAHNLSNELTSLKERNQKLEDDLNDAFQKKSKLEDEVQVITNELDRYKTKPGYEELSKHLTQLKTQLKEKSAALENKNQLIEKAEIQAKNKEVEFMGQLKEISNVKTTENNAIITEFNSKIKEYATIEKNLKENVSILNRENANIMERVTKINQEYNELRQEQENLKLELNNKKNLYDQQRQEFEEISRKEANDLKNEVSSLENKNQKLENEIKTSADKCLRLENEIGIIQNELRSTIKPNFEKLEEKLKDKDALLEKREKLIDERKTRNEELQNEILILKEANATLIKERDAAIKERINLLEEYESLKRDLEAREIVYEKELNRYEETFRKEENDLRSRVSVLKRDNAILQRKIDNVSEEKHRVEEQTRTNHNNLVEEIAQMGKQLKEKNATLGEFEEKERTMQHKISLLKYTNQSYSKDFEATKKEMQMLRQKYQDVKVVAERDDAKIQLESKGGVQHPILKNISSTITSIGFFEELAARLNTGDLKKIHVDLKKETTEIYGKKARNMNVAILKLINQLDDADIRRQNEEFKRLLKLKNDEIQRIESVFAFPDAIRKMRSDFEDATDKILNETEKDLVQFKQFFSGDGAFKFQTVIAQINAKYEEIIAMLSGELNRLQQIDSIVRNGISDMPKETNVDEEDAPDVRESLKKINEINRNTRELEIRVVKFRGNKENKMYLDLDHKLLENIMKIDVIQVNGSEKVRERRKEAIKYTNKCMERLQANLES